MTLVSPTSTTAAHAFGIALKRARRAARLTQAELAERAGFSVVYISMLERGARQPQLSTLALLADALDLSGDERVTFESSAQTPDTARHRASGDESGAPHLPVGGFLGALPSGPLVGRERELTVIHDVLSAVAAEQGRLLVLTGEPGVGKTRLAQEIMLRARVQGYHVATGCCYEPQQTVAYSPFLAAFSQIFAATSSTLQQEISRRWPVVTRLLPQHDIDQPTPDARSVDLGGGDDAQQRLYWQVANFLRAVARECPLVLLLDDLHWADAGSLELLRQLAHALRGEPVLFVGTYRDVEVSRQHPLEGTLRDLIREDLLERIVVRRLAPEETSALVAATLGAGKAAISAPLAQAIYQQTQGNAFFTREVARSLREGDSLTLLEEGWTLGAGSAVAVPESVRSVIGQRLGRLTPLTQEVLREASVLGHTFAFGDLRGLSGRGEQEVEEALEEAAGVGLVREAEHDAYYLDHALTRDTLYAELSARRKRRLHRAAGEAFEQGTAQERERRAAEISYHFLEADEGARALPYALVAGDQAEAVYAHAEAESHYRTALELARELGDQAREAEAFEKLGTTVLVLGHGDAALALLERALCGYQALQDQDGELRALSALIEAYIGRDMVEEAVARAQAILTRVEPRETPDASTLTPALASGLAAVYRSLASFYYTAGRFHEQLGAARRAGELARAAGDETMLVRASGLLHLAEAMLGETIDRAVLEDLLARMERTGETAMAADLYNNIAEEHEYAGEFAQMLAAAERGVALAERRQDPRLLATKLQDLAERFYYLGDWQRAREADARYASLVRELDPSGSSWESVGMSLWAGRLALAEGREDDGRRLLEQAIESIEKVSAVIFLAQVTCPLAEADLLAGHTKQAQLRLTSFLQYPAVVGRVARIALPLLAWAESARGKEEQAEARLATLLASAEPLIRVDALRVQGLLATIQGRWAVGVEALDETLERVRAMPYPYAEAKTLWVYGRLEAARGTPEAARERFAQALAICDRLGEGLYRTYIERDLRRLAYKA